MDILLGLLLVYGVLYAGRSAGRHVGGQVAAARTRARAAATARGGHHNREAVKRRAARQATIGYWAGEAGHLFPGIRHGFRRGWHQHQQALDDWKRERLEMGTDRAEREAGWRERLLDHSRRVAEASERGYERDYDDPPDGKTSGGPRENNDPPDDGKPRRTWIVHDDGDVDGPYTTGEAAGKADEAGPGARIVISPTRPQPGGTANSNGDQDMGHTGTADTTLSQAIADAEELAQAADQAVNDQALAKASGLSDKIQQALPNDREVPALAHDVENAAQDVQAAGKRLTDAAQAYKGKLEGYRPMQDALAASSGDDVPAEGFLPD